jgi:hypothetical protein
MADSSLKYRRDYERFYVEEKDCTYCALDVGSLNDATVVVLMRYTLKGGGDFNVNDRTRTLRQIDIRRFDVLGCRRLPVNLSHVEQAAMVAEWLADRPGVRVVLNISDIGRPAARSFAVLRPRHFEMSEQVTPEFLRSLLLHKLNNGTLRVARDLTVRLDDFDMEHVGDARACALAIWAVGQQVRREALRV